MARCLVRAGRGGCLLDLMCKWSWLSGGSRTARSNQQCSTVLQVTLICSKLAISILHFPLCIITSVPIPVPSAPSLLTISCCTHSIVGDIQPHSSIILLPCVHPSTLESVPHYPNDELAMSLNCLRTLHLFLRVSALVSAQFVATLPFFPAILALFLVVSALFRAIHSFLSVVHDTSTGLWRRRTRNRAMTIEKSV